MPPAILLRFLREHRSEWADSGIDAYAAAAVKAGPCSLPMSRAGNFGGQVILPLAHTIEHEEASASVLEYLASILSSLASILLTKIAAICYLLMPWHN